MYEQTNRIRRFDDGSNGGLDLRFVLRALFRFCILMDDLENHEVKKYLKNRFALSEKKCKFRRSSATDLQGPFFKFFVLAGIFWFVIIKILISQLRYRFLYQRVLNPI